MILFKIKNEEDATKEEFINTINYILDNYYFKSIENKSNANLNSWKKGKKGFYIKEIKEKHYLSNDNYYYLYIDKDYNNLISINNKKEYLLEKF